MCRSTTTAANSRAAAAVPSSMAAARSNHRCCSPGSPRARTRNLGAGHGQEDSRRLEDHLAGPLLQDGGPGREGSLDDRAGLRQAAATKELITYPISNNYFRIPPGAENHRVTACWTAQEDIHLTGARPHMHKRGKAMEFKVFYPDGRSEMLLNVPRYDFSWQTLYNFKQPLSIPKGTRFMVTGYLDNSAKNKNNPDPARAVRFGEPTYDEMMIGLIEYTVDSQSLKPAAAESAGGATQK